MGIFENKEVKFIYSQLHNQSINWVLENAVRKITSEKLNILWVQFPLQMCAFCWCLPLGFFACSIFIIILLLLLLLLLHVHICLDMLDVWVWACACRGTCGSQYEVYFFFLPQCGFQGSNAGQQVCAAGPFPPGLRSGGVLFADSVYCVVQFGLEFISFCFSFPALWLQACITMPSYFGILFS